MREPGRAAANAGRVSRALRRSPAAIAGGVILAAFYLVAAFGSFLAPYREDDADRARFYQPPQVIRWRDAAGRFHARPFVHPMRLADPSRFGYVEDRSRTVPLRFFVREAPAEVGRRGGGLRLFGADPPERVYLLGADSQGRDVLSRLVSGAQVSLTVGLVGIVISFTLGMLLGGISGYLGGWVDVLLMRFTELLLSIPGLYLILALRAVFPAEMPTRLVYLGIVAILALIGWASLARVIRGLVLSLREREYVAAAEALGASRMRVLVRHLLPNTLSFVIVAATLSVPGYILGEVVLSFLGVGVQEPSASWGNMLQQARSFSTLTAYPWLLWAPAAAIFLTVMAWNFLGDGLRDALDPRGVTGSRH